MLDIPYKYIYQKVYFTHISSGWRKTRYKFKNRNFINTLINTYLILPIQINLKIIILNFLHSTIILLSNIKKFSFKVKKFIRRMTKFIPILHIMSMNYIVT